jgi:hypothetical protein
MSEPLHSQSSGESSVQPSSVRKVIVASVIGTSLEWYDFFIYGTAAARPTEAVAFSIPMAP